MGDSIMPTVEGMNLGDHVCCGCNRTNRTPTPGAHSAISSMNSLLSQSPPLGSRPHVVYIVTDTCYPTQDDFGASKGTFSIDSVHSSRGSANARAKKMIFQSGASKIDVDKVIEEIDPVKGLYTGIGIGGKADGQLGSAYARKCGVEQKFVDEDSEDDGEGEELNSSQEERKSATTGGDGDVEMG